MNLKKKLSVRKQKQHLGSGTQCAAACTMWIKEISTRAHSSCQLPVRIEWLPSHVAQPMKQGRGPGSLPVWIGSAKVGNFKGAVPPIATHPEKKCASRRQTQRCCFAPAAVQTDGCSWRGRVCSSAALSKTGRNFVSFQELPEKFLPTESNGFIFILCFFLGHKFVFLFFSPTHFIQSHSKKNTIDAKG